MSIWSLCTRPILLGCKHTCFCEKSDSPFLWMSFERWSSESRIGCTYSPLHRTFHTSPPPYTSSVRHKTMGVCWQFSNTHLLHHWSPLPPLSFRPSKVEYPDPKFCPVLSRLIGYAVNCLYCWKFVLKPKCSFPTSFDGQNICVPLQCVKWASLFNCADHFKSQQSNSRTVVIILNFLGTGKLGDWVNYPAASTCFILNLSGKLSLGPVKDKV